MNRYAGLGFQWSDGWLLLSIALTATDRPARLCEVIATADAINHAILTHAEVDQGIERLLAARLIVATPASLAITEEGGRLVQQAGRQTRDIVSQMIALTVSLEAAEHPTLPPSDCKGTFVSRAEYDAAVNEHHNAFSSAMRKQRPRT